MWRKLLLSSVVLVLVAGAAFAADVFELKISYNGPPDEKENAVHSYVVKLQKFIEEGTGGRIKFTLFPNSGLGKEEERMDLTRTMPIMNVASYAGVAPLFPELYAASIPFMFDSYKAAHIFFDESEYWKKAQEAFKMRTGVALLEAVEEGGFLAFTNSKREIRSPKDFKGLKFRAMDEGQIIIYKSMGASAVPIPWTELYMALKTGVVDGQMNPPMYIIIGSLYEVQKYMCMANVQYSDQFLVVNAKWFDSLSPEDQKLILEAAKKANVLNRQEVESMVDKRVEFLKEKGMQVYYPTKEEMDEFRNTVQPAYVDWLKKKVGEDWLNLALECAKRANEKASK
ncbi:MAG: TRAP transporter substrate-binding protein DctP [Synergistetes bacterium]|nr:TRAP transporter substrate-binding protein DctP [Synergistota bacterium]